MKKKYILIALYLNLTIILLSLELNLDFLCKVQTILSNKELTNLVIHIENSEQYLHCKTFSDFLTNNISHKIITECSSIKLIERDDFNLIEDELLLQCNGLFDDESVVYLGHLTGAQAILSIKYTVSDNNIELTIKTIDIEKGEVLYVNNEF